MPTFFSHLECSIPCAAGPYDPRLFQARCSCGAPLIARYDLTAAKRWPKTSLAGREASMWRYREILPLLQSNKGPDVPVTLGEGWTPLLRTRRLTRTIGVDGLYVKDESSNPTNTMKARGMSTLATRALHLGLRVLSSASSGHATPAVAAYASRAGLDAKVFVPKDIRQPILRQCRLTGADITRVDGGPGDAARAAAQRRGAHIWADATPFAEPYRLEGEKTLGYEIAEQLEWQVPDWIVCPVGSGSSLIAIWKAFGEMAALGWIDPVKRPHMVAVQAAGCAPLVRAFASGASKALPWEGPQTVADGLRVAETAGDFLVLRALRDSAGAAVSVGDTEMIAGMKEFAQLEGVSASPEGGAALHAVRVLTSQGRIKPHEVVVILNTGGALTYLDQLG